MLNRVIHQSPDASNHRTPSKYRTEIQVIRVYISGSCRRRAHLRLQGTPIYCIRASIAARQAGHFTHIELAVFFTGSTKCKSIATLCTRVWQQSQVSKRLVLASPFTCYIFHGFVTRLSGCINIFLKDFLLLQLSHRIHGLSTRLCSRTPSELRGQLQTGSGTDRVRLARREWVSLRLLKLILYLRSHWYPVNPLREE